MIDSLPNSPESEQAILGAILQEPHLLERVREELTPDRFYVRSNRLVYSALLAMREAGTAIDEFTLASELRNRNEYDLVGGMAGIAQLRLGVPCGFPKAHISEVIRLARKRAVISFASRLLSRAEDRAETEDELLAYATNWIDNARTKLPHTAKVRALSDFIDTQAERYRKWHRGISDAIPTGFHEIDDHLQGAGLVPSGLYVLAANTSMGKSALMLDIAANVAGEGKTVYLVSREMPGESLFDRLHAAHAGIPRWKLRQGIYKSDYDKLIATLPQVTARPIIIDNLSTTVADVRANIRDQERKHRRPELLIVDYLQLVDGVGRSRNEEVGSVTRALKQLAMELHVPVIGLSQLSRENEKHKREPELFDLRDSGELEQDADAVFLLFGERPEEGSKIYPRTLKCAKQRDGELFRVEMTFNAELVTFRSFEQLAAGHYQSEAVQ